MGARAARRPAAGARGGAGDALEEGCDGESQRWGNHETMESARACRGLPRTSLFVMEGTAVVARAGAGAARDDAALGSQPNDAVAREDAEEGGRTGKRFLMGRGGSKDGGRRPSPLAEPFPTPAGRCRLRQLQQRRNRIPKRKRRRKTIRVGPCRSDSLAGAANRNRSLPPRGGRLRAVAGVAGGSPSVESWPLRSSASARPRAVMDSQRAKAAAVAIQLPSSFRPQLPRRHRARAHTRGAAVAVAEGDDGRSARAGAGADRCTGRAPWCWCCWSSW